MVTSSSDIRTRRATVSGMRYGLALLLGGVVLGLDRFVEADLLALAVVLPGLLILSSRGMVPPDPAPTYMPGATIPDLNALIAYLDRRSRDGAMPSLLCLHPVLRSESALVNGTDAFHLAARIVRSALRPEDMIAADGDGRMVIALSSHSDTALEPLVQIAMRLQKMLRHGIDTEVGQAYFMTSAGLQPAASRAGIANAAERVTAGLSALARASGQSPMAIRVADDEASEAMPLQLQLAVELDSALENGQIHPYFQPQVSTDTGHLTGVEALARWTHPVHGTLSPAQFLPTVAAAGAENALTDTILGGAVSALSTWDAAGIDVPRVSVNMTYADLNDDNLVDRIACALAAAGLTADRIGIEVLETVLCLDADDAVPRTLQILREMGCQIDLDDFGTGQASIASIRRFSISRLKIDRSFVRGIDKDPEQQSMVAAIVTMAEQLRLDVLAEGIETTEEHARAAELGCGAVQGFGIGRPMRADALPGWVSRWTRYSGDAAMPQSLRDLVRLPRPESSPDLRTRPPSGKTA